PISELGRHTEPMPTIETAGLTDTGRVRETNEDSFIVATLQRSLLVHDTSPGARGWFAGDGAGTMLVVADGMGGQGGGDVASQTAVRAVVNHLLNCIPWTGCEEAPPSSPAHSASLPGVRDGLSTALEVGDSTVRTAGENSGTPRMGTTLTLALIMWPALYVAHVGDTRCYLYRGGKLTRLTTDHTLAQQLAQVSAKPVDPSSHLNHVLWNSLGASQNAPQPEIRRVGLERGDLILLCSDGLTKHVGDERIAQFLGTRGPPRERCAMLIAEANAQGGTDNITAVIAELG
ncbi:MAG TPA: protein phosphatase 2C domain-containing protein, partial [Polyangiaceae bacterium]